MLHVILTILKIIGIIVAALLGIVLAVLLLVLFVPIGYDARVDNKSDIMVKANGWWLFHMFHVSFNMQGLPSEEKGNKPVIDVRILGIPIRDLVNKKEQRQEKKTAAKKAKQTKKRHNTQQKTAPVKPLEQETTVTAQELKAKDVEPAVTTQELSKEKPVTKVIEKTDALKEAQPKSASPKEREGKVDDKKNKESVKQRKRSSFIDNIKVKIGDIKKKVENISDRKEKLQQKISLVRAFLQTEENVLGIKKVFHSIKKLLKHLLPNKIKGYVQFGLNDPCSTGQALGVLALLYPYYGKSLIIEPDFTRQVIEGDVYLKGYIQIFTVCVISIRLILDANFKKLLGNFKKLKAEFSR